MDLKIGASPIGLEPNGAADNTDLLAAAQDGL
jgi:hypothetical protein